MVSLAEMAPAMVRKNAGKYIAQLVPVILQFMADIEEEEDWSKSDELLDEENDSNHVVAEAALDRLACGLGEFSIFSRKIHNNNLFLHNPTLTCYYQN